MRPHDTRDAVSTEYRAYPNNKELFALPLAFHKVTFMQTSTRLCEMKNIMREMKCEMPEYPTSPNTHPHTPYPHIHLLKIMHQKHQNTSPAL
jgi:hypothetical protein